MVAISRSRKRARVKNAAAVAAADTEEAVVVEGAIAAVEAEEEVTVGVAEESASETGTVARGRIAINKIIFSFRRGVCSA
jgi:hypothetical protein